MPLQYISDVTLVASYPQSSCACQSNKSIATSPSKMFSTSACPKITLTMAQVIAMQKKSIVVPRGNLVPVYNISITKYENVDSVDRNQEPVTTHTVEVPEGRLSGIHSKAPMKVVNRGPGPTKVKVINPDGSTEETSVEVGAEVVTYFEGRIAIVHLPAEDGLPDRARIGFDRYFLSNFLVVDATEFTIKDTGYTINASCLEDVFQKVKAVLTGDMKVLEDALAQNSCPKLKKYMNTAKGIPAEWFEAPLGGKTLAFQVMEYLQAWCATCPVRNAFLVEIMKIATDLGVSPDNVEICEYTDDSNYGCGVVPGDFMPILAEGIFKPKGKNFLGPVISAVARKVVELGSHAAYVNWFKETYPPLFELESTVEKEETVDEIPSLGARLASDVDLSPSGRTGSNGRTLSFA